MNQAAASLLQQAKLPSERSSARDWHCLLCDVRVPKRRRLGPGPQEDAASSAEWTTHLRGKVHQVRLLSKLSWQCCCVQAG